MIDLAEPFNDVYATPVHNKKVGDEVVYIGEDDRVVRAATNATSLEAEQESGSRPRCQDTTLEDENAQTRFETASKKSYNPPLSKVNTSESEEDWMNLFKIGTSRRQSLDKENVSKQERNLKTRSMFEEGGIDDNRDDTDDMVDEAMKNVEGETVNAGGTVNTATTRVSAASASVTTAGVSISTAEPRTPPTTITTVFEDEDLIIAQTLIKIRSEKAKEKGVAFRYVEESARPKKFFQLLIQDKDKGIMQEPKKPPKNPRMTQIQLDEELAKKMHEEEMAEFKKRQSEIGVEEANRAAIKATINQELDDIQAIIEADEQMAQDFNMKNKNNSPLKKSPDCWWK
nr:hypothetical protein [Tanacetum cinerariifolium]